MGEGGDTEVELIVVSSTSAQQQRSQAQACRAMAMRFAAFSETPFNTTFFGGFPVISLFSSTPTNDDNTSAPLLHRPFR
jgi:hypothetical protein